MKQYCIYQLDKSGHIADLPEIFACENDADVIETAKRLVDGYDIEVWDRERLVIRFLKHK